MKNRIAVLGIVTALVVAVGIAVMPMPHTASAQVGPYQKTAIGAVGNIVPVFNALADTLIADGTWLMADTTAATGTNIRRIAVKPWNCSQTSEQQVVGISVGQIPRGRTGGSGQMLIWGFHPNAYMTSGITYGQAIGPSFASWGGGNVIADTLAMGRGNGFFIKYVSATSTRAQIFLVRLGTVRL